MASVIDGIHASRILNAFDIALLLANDLDLGCRNELDLPGRQFWNPKKGVFDASFNCNSVFHVRNDGWRYHRTVSN